VAAAFGHDHGGPPATAPRDTYLALWTALLKKMDTDGDGKISRDEFVTAVARSIVTREDGFTRYIEPIAQAILSMADTNGSGELDADEFSRMWVVIGVPADDTAQAFQQLDRDPVRPAQPRRDHRRHPRVLHQRRPQRPRQRPVRTALTAVTTRRTWTTVVNLETGASVPPSRSATRNHQGRRLHDPILSR
jgi:EF hand domain-containing protein